MKKYKLLKDLPTLKAGAIFAINDCGTLHYVDKDNSINLHKHELDKMRKEGTFDEWFEETEDGSKVWKPKEGDGYYYTDSDGCVKYYTNDDLLCDRRRIMLGNCFRTQEDGEQAVEKLKALRRLREKGLKFNRTLRYSYELAASLENEGFIVISFSNDVGCQKDNPMKYDEETQRDLDLLFKEENEDE